MDNNSLPRLIWHSRRAPVIHTSFMHAEEFDVLLDIGTFHICCPVERLLCVRPSHIGTLPPLGLDGVPGFLSCSRGYYAESRNVCTVQGYVTTDELVTESPLVNVWFG